MFFINLKSQNIVKGYTSNSFNFPAAVYLKKKSTISNSYRRVCGGSPYTFMLYLPLQICRDMQEQCNKHYRFTFQSKVFFFIQLSY